MRLSLAIILSIVILLFGRGFLSVYAQEEKDLLVELENIRDPFMPQLPPPKVLPQPQSAVNPSGIVAQSQLVNGGPNDPSRFIPKVPDGMPKTLNNTPKAQDLHAVTVKGLVWNTDIPQAIVNDAVVRVGDVVSGMKIISIRQKGVEIVNNGVNVYLKISDRKDAFDKKP